MAQLGEGLGRLFDVESNISRNNTGNTKCVSLKGLRRRHVRLLGSCWRKQPGHLHREGVGVVRGRVGVSYVAFNPISRYYNKALDDGTTQWTDSGDLTANLGTITVLSGQVSFYVGADDLPSMGDSYVQVAPGTSGIVTAIMHDPVVQRNPGSTCEGSQQLIE